MKAAMNAATGIRLFTWLPIVLVVGLIAWATRWWVAVIAVVYFGVTVGAVHLYRRRLKQRFEADPGSARAYADRAQRRVFRWAKAGGLFFVALLLGLLVLVIVSVAVDGHG